MKKQSAASKSPDLTSHPKFEVGEPDGEKRGNVDAVDHSQHRGKKDGNRRKRNKGRS